MLTATMAYKQRAGEEADLERHAAFRTNLNLKVVPSVDGGIAVRELRWAGRQGVAGAVSTRRPSGRRGGDEPAAMLGAAKKPCKTRL